MKNILHTLLASIALYGIALADPLLVSRSPADDSLNNPYNTNIVATFDENIIAGAGTITLRNLTNPSRSRTITASDSTQVSLSGRVLTIDPTFPLDADSAYAVQFSANAVLNLSNVPFAGIPETDVTAWNIRTGAPSVVDVLFVYTPAALAFHGTEAGMLAHIQACIAATNDAFARSGAIGQIRLVGSQLVSYTESNSYETDLNRLTEPADGIMDSVHSLRNTVGADLVCLLRRGVDSEIRGGFAWQPTSTSGEPDKGFSVVMTENALASLTFTHELGHNFGLGHARGDSQGTGIFADSVGYRFTGQSGTQYRTIMAVSTTGSTRISHFSNPQVNFDGVATGVAPPSAANSANAARTLSIMAPVIAGYRNAVTSNAPPSWNDSYFYAWDAIVGQAYQMDLEIHTSDINSDALTHTLVSGPSWLSISDSTIGRVVGTPSITNLGINEFTVRVSDGVNPPVDAVMWINVLAETGRTWLGTSGDWTNPSIWSGGVFPNGTNFTANFTGIDIASNRTINLNEPAWVGNIIFTDAGVSSHNLTISGTNMTLDVSASSGPPVLSVTQADRTLTISSKLVGIGSRGLRKMGAGTVVLSGNNDYRGETSVIAGTLRLEGTAFSTLARNYVISSGAVLHNVNGQIPSDTTIISGSGTLRGSFRNDTAPGLRRHYLYLSMGAGGLIDVPTASSIFNGGWSSIFWTNNLATLNVNGSVNIWDGNAITAAALTGSGTVESTFNNGTAANFTLGVNNGSGTFSGNITATGTRVVSLVKNGSGNQTFSGTTTFRGTTTINGGTLQLAKNTALYAGVTSTWVKTKITVNQGGTIALNVGGSNEFTPSNVTTLLNGIGGTVSNNGLRAGSAIAIDTTNASGGTFTMADAISNTSGTGGGTISFRKWGNNTLELSGNSTYTGPTSVDQGTLAVTGSLGATAVSVNSGILRGNGNFGGNVTIAPGATHSLAVAATAAGQDTSTITGTLAMNGSTLNLTAPSTPAAGVYVLATATEAITGTPSTINYNGINGTISVDATSTPKRLLLTISGSAYSTWTQQTFAKPFTLTTPTNNPDGDSLSNLLEFAFGTDPTMGGNTLSYVPGAAVNSGGAPVAMNIATGGAVDFRAVFARRKDHATVGLTYTVQFSADLIHWENSSVVPTVLSGSGTVNPAAIESVSVPYPALVPVSGGGQKKPTFFRVTVAMP